MAKAGLYADLVGQEMIGTVTVFFEHCITESFMVLPVEHMTASEVKRRFEVVDRIFCQLRGDLHWSYQRIFEFMPAYVRAELEGVKWEPGKESSWVVPGA